ncbi:FMRF-amide neuropeptides-like [Palaemon carinicauda]|uniref:FMRF-amide neuropeptides-like n=1 Tax=Palaemon carinicauda TaxID=392227 RepID=UPI0035B5FB25
MIIATWVLLAVLSCLCQALAPPVTVALQSNTRDPAAHDDGVIALPAKRILKYFLPSAQAWATHGAGGGVVAVPTGPEGNKRGYGDRNFLRFGRSGDAVKKDTSSGRNFLRFGRGGNDEYEGDEDGLASIEKRNRNFLRFGRDRNFLRFGRSDPEQFGLEAQPLELSRSLDDGPVEDERADLENYLRYSRPDKNFLRFGRTYDKNFLRFGRSVDAQTLCDDCEEENLNKHLETASFSSSSSSSFPATRVSAEQNVDGDYQLVKEAKARPLADANEKKDVHRSKREASTYFSSSITAPHGDFDTAITGPHGEFDTSVSGSRGDLDTSASGPQGDFDSSISGPHGPDFWGRDSQHSEEQVDERSASLGLDDLQGVAKRPYTRDFLRFGRDRNFLRFGKRFDGTPSESDMMMMTPLQYTSKRVSHNNFLRFG